MKAHMGVSCVGNHRAGAPAEWSLSTSRGTPGRSLLSWAPPGGCGLTHL